MAVHIAERRISNKAFIVAYACAGVAGIAVMFGLISAAQLLLIPLVAILPLGVWAYGRLAHASTAYRLFEDRLEVESGILNRKIENVQLFRVRDVGLRQGFVGRITDFGDVYLHSTDSSAPDVHIRGIDAPREFYEQLRELVTTSRAQSRTMIVEEGQTIVEPH